jgi:hypothetical protein
MSISEQEKMILLGARKARVDASIKAKWARIARSILPGKASESNTAVSAPEPKSNAQASSSESKDNTQASSSEVEQPAVNRSGGTDADRKKWKEFLTGADLRNAPPASDAVRETHPSP